MMNFCENNEDFLKMLEKEYPEIDWDNLPSKDSKPTYWIIKGAQWRRLDFVFKGKEIKDKLGFEMGKYSSQEEAQAALEAMSSNPTFTEERLIKDQTVPGHKLEGNDLAHKEYIGPVLFETLHLFELLDDELHTLYLYKSFRDSILKGKKVFPLRLP